MSDRCFVDTNILVYAHDRSGGEKHLRAQTLIAELWRTGAGVLSTQVLQEFCVNLRRKTAKPPSVEALRAIVQDYLTWKIVVNDGDSVIEALALEYRYSISFWDALIIHAAEVAEASILYSEDLSDGQWYGTVRAVNPFKIQSEAPST